MDFLGIRVPAPFSLFRPWERYEPLSGETRIDRLYTVQQIPNTYAQQRPREASPTGKSGMGIATYSQMPQAIMSARRKTVLPINANRASGHLQTTGHIDPYDSITKQPTNRANVKFTP